VTAYAGQRITASEVNNLGISSVRKSGNQSVSSSTVLVNDTQLFVPLAASTAYGFNIFVFYTGAATGTGDIKMAWSLPSGATMTYQWLIDNLSNATQMGQGNGGVLFCGSNGAVVQAASMQGSILTSTTVGNLQLQWAQDTSNATATVVQAGSILNVWFS